MHANGGVCDFNAQQVAHGEAGGYSMWSYMTTSRFWFESFQNWQSEFLAVGAIVLASIWLREKGSPESKPVAAAHGATGE
jgi:endo-1,4-beta-D-glucanase Y